MRETERERKKFLSSCDTLVCIQVWIKNGFSKPCKLEFMSHKKREYHIGFIEQRSLSWCYLSLLLPEKQIDFDYHLSSLTEIRFCHGEPIKLTQKSHIVQKALKKVSFSKNNICLRIKYLFIFLQLFICSFSCSFTFSAVYLQK